MAKSKSSGSGSAKPGTRETAGKTTAKGSNTTRAYDGLRRRILDNELKPGSHHLEQDLAVLLGMSRTPVREALIRLAQDGLVEIRPRHGARILPVSWDDMRDIYDLLAGLEAQAARQLAADGISGEDLARLDQAVADMDCALQRDDLKAWAAADEGFHDTLIALCRNSRLKAIVRTFLDQSHRVRMQTLHLRPKPVASNRDHAALVDAIRRRDAEAAYVIHHDHRKRAGKMLLGLLTTHNLDDL